MIDGIPNGKGEFISKSYNYTGDFVDGKRHGNGIFKWKDGTYEGGFSNGKVNGYGSLKYDHRDRRHEYAEHKTTVYVRNGLGERPVDLYLFCSGELSYKGNFLNGKMHGKGFIKYPNGDMYDGDWVNGRIEGIGSYSSHINDVQLFKGEFMNGRLEGNGEEYVNGELHYSGQWKDGYHHGNGRMIIGAGSKYSKARANCEGVFVKGRLVKGKEVFDDKTVFEGSWPDSDHANGKVTYLNGDSYDGDITDYITAPRLEGKGKFTFGPNSKHAGDVFIGTWKYGKAVGSGELITNGKRYSGNVKDSVFSGGPMSLVRRRISPGKD